MITTDSQVSYEPFATVDWSSGVWDRNRRKYMAGEIDPAIELGHHYLKDVLNLELSPVSVYPYIGTGGLEARGGSVSPSKMELFFTGREIDRRKLGLIFGEITTTIIHEAVHCFRSRYFTVEHLLEIVATEGLAHYAQACAEQEIFNVPHSDTFFVQIGDSDGEDLIEELYNHPGLLKDLSPVYKQPSPLNRYAAKIPRKPKNEVKDLWLYNPDGIPFGWGQRLGLWCVNSWIEDHGKTFAELITMPPEDLIAA